jgi:hypothetical protein
MIRCRLLWDVCEVSGRRWLYPYSTSVTQALRKLQGAPMDSHIEAGGMADRDRGVVCIIALPVGTKEVFEEMTGYRLTRTETGT